MLSIEPQGQFSKDKETADNRSLLFYGSEGVFFSIERFNTRICTLKLESYGKFTVDH